RSEEGEAMSTTTKTLAVLVGLCLLAVAAIEASRAQEKRATAGTASTRPAAGAAAAGDAAAPQVTPEQFKQMVARMSAIAPEHALLDQLAGEWKFTSKLWVQAGTQPLTGSGKTVNTWILGRRFLQSKSTGEGSIWSE